MITTLYYYNVLLLLLFFFNSFVIFTERHHSQTWSEKRTPLAENVGYRCTNVSRDRRTSIKTFNG
jgi:hypothetical protein